MIVYRPVITLLISWPVITSRPVILWPGARNNTGNPPETDLRLKSRQSRLSISSLLVHGSFWSFGQRTEVSLPCYMQNFRRICRPKLMLWANEILRHFSSRWISVGWILFQISVFDGNIHMPPMMIMPTLWREMNMALLLHVMNICSLPLVVTSTFYH